MASSVIKKYLLGYCDVIADRINATGSWNFSPHHRALVFASTNSYGTQVYKTEIIPSSLIADRVVRTFNLYDGNNEANFSFPEYGTITLTGITGDLYVSIYAMY